MPGNEASVESNAPYSNCEDKVLLSDPLIPFDHILS